MIRWKGIAWAAALALLLAGGFISAVAQESEKAPPETIVFESKMGNVTFQHATHTEREGGNCESCHPGLFPQAREPLGYKAGMHKPAEAAKKACAGCHFADGKSFETKGNCKTCHVKD